MIGAIIGDIVGSTREFANTLDYDFELFPKGSSYTDDTVCTIAVADAILRGIPYRNSLVEWCRRYPSPMGGYGASFSQWIYYPIPYDSFGNGAAMRISPVGWAFTGSDIGINAEKATACSHSHEEGIKGALVTALAVSLAKKKDAQGIEIVCREFYGKDYGKRLPDEGVWDETCQGCVPLAIRLFLQSADFEDAIRLAVSYGGDSDTLGAIVGGIAGAYYGVPDWMREKAISILPEDMRKVLSNFELKYCNEYGQDLF